MHQSEPCTESHEVYHPNHCISEACPNPPVGLGVCAGHLFRWALHCRHISHDHTLAA